MSRDRLNLGRWGEDEAARYLQQQGMKVLQRNLKTPVGEIDILARKGRYLVFVEVKTRRSLKYGSPQEAVGAAKQRQILRAAQWYLSSRPVRLLQPRFDVISILRQGEDVAIEHFQDAFGL